MKYWLIKSEPESYSIDQLESNPVSPWDGVRNYQARNNMRLMKKGDKALFYQSNAKPSGVVGIAVVSREAYADPTALDPKSAYFDPKSSAKNNRWNLVDFKFVARSKRVISLAELKAMKRLAGMVLLTHSRLSVSAVTEKEWDIITGLKDTWK